MNEDGYDVVVVGSGYGGSVDACRMAMAGINVCLVERGRRWEAKGFPANTFQMVSAVRMDFTNRGVGFGKKDALFQVTIFMHSFNLFNHKNFIISLNHICICNDTDLCRGRFPCRGSLRLGRRITG